MVKILLFFILGALPVIQGSITHYGTYDLPGYPTKVYYYDKDNQSWKDARTKCQEAGMDLVRMDSKAEETHLFNMIQLDTSIPRRQWIHVGGMKLGDDWIWRSDYTKIYSGMKWGPGEPNYWKNSEFCLALEKNQGTGIAGYIDGSCTEHKSPFMCESHMSTEIKPTSILISNDPAINEVLNVLMATIGSSQTSIHKFKTTKIVIANHEYDDTLVKETTENNI